MQITRTHMIKKYNNIVVKQWKQRILLTEHELEQAYCEQLQKYRILDAENHCNQYLADESIHLEKPLDQSDYERLTYQFNEQYDCNQPENDIWYNIVKCYIDSLLQ